MNLRLKDLREDRDLLQEDIAKLLNVKQQAYSNYETDKRRISIELAIVLAKFYNTSLDYIFGLTDVRKPYPRRKICDNDEN